MSSEGIEMKKSMKESVLSNPAVAGGKKVWTAPNIQTLDMDRARGAANGPNADLFGSLSTP